MCGRYTLRAKLNNLLDQFAAEMADQEGVHERYNIAPGQQVLAVRLVEGSEKREIVRLKWGLIPSWTKDAKLAQINARADGIATKPMFRNAFKKRRCLILADGYYEWLRVGKSKQPYLYEVDHGKPFAIAGLWESWRSALDAAPLETCAIITTEANELARQIHDRMPVILHEDDYQAWLAGDQIPLIPFPAAGMKSRLANPFLNNVLNEGPDCLKLPLPERPLFS
jgi:putative SOS response-associated peptidase YedK